MSGWKRLMAVSAVVVAAMASAVTPTSAAGPRTRWVDSDGHAGPAGCNSSAHASTTIQHAVDASHRGDTVKVCPGTYLEQVTIKGHRDGLTLESFRKWGATIKAPTSLEAAGPYGFTVLVLIDRVDYVTVRGFKVVTRTQAPCDIVGAGIAAIASKQTAIRGNRLFAPGTSTEPGSCYQLNGIVAIDSFSVTGLHARSSSATIGFNEVRDALNFSIGVEADRQPVRADIVHNSVRAYFGQQPAVTAAIMPAAPGLGGTVGIGLLRRVQGTIRDNVVQGAMSAPIDGPGFFAAILVAGNGLTPGVTNGPISIHDNTVRRVSAGVILTGASQLTVRDNWVGNSINGLSLAAVVDSSVRHNTVITKTAGIQVDTASSGDSLRSNSFTGNGGTCSDSSSGSGTAGTDNQWSGNTASQGSNPAGICTVTP